VSGSASLPPSFPSTTPSGSPRSWPWRGPIDQIITSRATYLKALAEAGKSEARSRTSWARWGVSRHIYVAPTDAEALAEAKDAEMWYQEALRRLLIPQNIDRVHPLL